MSVDTPEGASTRKDVDIAARRHNVGDARDGVVCSSLDVTCAYVIGFPASNPAKCTTRPPMKPRNVKHTQRERQMATAKPRRSGAAPPSDGEKPSQDEGSSTSRGAGIG